MRRVLFALPLAALALLFVLQAGPVWAQTGVNISLNQTSSGGLGLHVDAGGNEPQQLSGLMKILLLLTALSLAPSLLVLCTSFTRILIVLSFLRQAIGVTHVPPNQVLIGIALFLTAFNMQPVWNQIQVQAVKPYQAGTISWQQAGERGLEPVRAFMLRQTRPKDLSLFLKLARQTQIRHAVDTPTLVLIPAFILSELRAAFQIGFLLYLPFLVIDMVVASILLSMGMMMLPPVMISLPFKILLFVLIDGWNVLVFALLKSFH
jgi:flagellar biosynthesis protein FliP